MTIEHWKQMERQTVGFGQKKCPAPGGARGAVEQTDGRVGFITKAAAVLLAGALCLGLAGCAGSPPERAADGLSWDESWVTVGGTVGVDTPEGMDLRENNDALAVSGMYYATWSMGEAEPYTNEDGDDVALYGAQLYLLVDSCQSAAEAESTLAQWKDMASRQYIVSSSVEENHNGVDFAVITYTFDSDTNPYAQGVSAFGVYQNCAISAEFTCQEDFNGDAAQLLAVFLDSCHYAIS